MAKSDPRFRSFHALRIKGFAKSDVVAEIAAQPLADVEGQVPFDVVAEIAAQPLADVEGHLADLQKQELALFREARALWQLTPAGKEAHKAELAKDITDDARNAISEHYDGFLELNVAFKSLCGDWQLIDGDGSKPNDHSDATYDKKVIDRLLSFDAEARPVVTALGAAHERMAPYAPRLGGSLERLLAGETKMFTGVMCNSYHDVWMELHEDLILSLGIDRAAEGSF